MSRTSEAPGFSRRRFFGAAAASVAAGQLGLLGFLRRLPAMTATLVEVDERAGTEHEHADAGLRPFRVNVPDAELTDLRNRVKATRWPDRETVGDDTQGVRLATVKALARYWGTDYDWRKVE